jgi:outer membrane protein TolC
LNERLLATNLQLAIEAARVGGAEKSRDLAYRNRYPDMALGIVPMQVSNRVDAWSLMLEMNIPLQQGTRRSQERESERMLEAAAARKEALGHRLQGDLNSALNNLEGARRTEQITRSRLLPQAELTFKSALAGYETGKVDFATLLDAQRQIRNARLALLRAQASQQMRLAEIERLLGEDL